MRKLTCPSCGSELHLHMGFDGCDWESVAGEGSGYNWSLYLACPSEDCGRIYQLIRMKGRPTEYSDPDFSEVVEERRSYVGRLND